MWSLPEKQKVSHDRVKEENGQKVEATACDTWRSHITRFSAGTNASDEGTGEAARCGPLTPGADDRRRLGKLMRSAILIG